MKTFIIFMLILLVGCEQKLPEADIGHMDLINAEVPPGSTDIKQDSEGWVTFKNGTKCYTYRRLIDPSDSNYSYPGNVYETDCPDPSVK